MSENLAHSIRGRLGRPKCADDSRDTPPFYAKSAEPLGTSPARWAALSQDRVGGDSYDREWPSRAAKTLW